MSYRIRRREPIQTALRRIAGEEIDRALAELADARLDRHEAVHQGRKRCKKIRALLRLVRPAFKSDFAFENAWYRDAARDLSWVRDAQVVFETHAGLVQRYRGSLEAAAVTQLQSWLQRRRDRAAADPQALHAAVTRFSERLSEGRARVADWTLARDGFAAVSGGLGQTYCRGRRAIAAAYAAPDTARFHEWRKQVKYHWYHLRLLQSLYPPLLKAQRDQADRLGALLGEEHDLAVLRALLTGAEDCPLAADAAQPLLAVLDRRREQLRAKARVPGALLFCEKPKRLQARFGCYWRHSAD